MSETSVCRKVLGQWAIGNGCDLGFGGDAINETCITVDREEHHTHRAHVGNRPTNLVWDIGKRLPFRVGVMDYIYSSHALEDFQDTVGVLAEWLRVIRPNGHLILFLPDQQAYEAHCKANNAEPNAAHVHKNFSREYVLDCLTKTGVLHEFVWSSFPFEESIYSFALVIKKL